MKGMKVQKMAVRWAVVLVWGATGGLLYAAESDLRTDRDKVTFDTLLADMTDLERLVEHPGDRYRCKMASSYDRKSTDPKVANEENWLANRDFVSKDDLAQFVRVETRPDGEKEYVMMDVSGPGAIVRIWSAVAERAGTIRIYLDGADTPTIEMPMDHLLAGVDQSRQLLGAKGKAGPAKATSPLAVPFPISRQLALGWNTSLPIPFASGCKVTASRADETWWYQITYRAYEPGTPIETFTLPLTSAREKAMAETAARLKKPSLELKQRLPAGGELKSHQHRARIDPGQSVALRWSEDEHAIYRLQVCAEAGDMDAALRACLLEITFDEPETPQVQAPLGDFFATAPGINPYESLPMAVTEDGRMRCDFVMPFKRSCAIRVTNHGRQPVQVDIEAQTAPRPWTDRTMYFHAAWRGSGSIRSMPRRDWNYIEISGDGRYLGNALHIVNMNKHWWGEGDEKIYTDGEAFPSIFGTGTEDYYSYACCSRELFSHAYHNQTRCDGPGNSGHTCLSRFHVLDDIPFARSLRFDMEIWHWEDAEIYMAATSWWYGLPGARDNREPLQPGRLTLPALLPPDQRPGHSVHGD